MTKYVYLAGPISGLTEFASRYWRDALEAEFREQCYWPSGLEVQFLNPMRHVRPAYHNQEVWGEARWPATIDITMMRDLRDIERSEVVVFGGFDGAPKVSIGSMIEWGYAKALGKKIMLISDPKVRQFGPHAHPWLDTADFQVSHLYAAAEVLRFYLIDREGPHYKPYGEPTHGKPVSPAGHGMAEPDPAVLSDLDRGVGDLRPTGDEHPDPYRPYSEIYLAGADGESVILPADDHEAIKQWQQEQQKRLAAAEQAYLAARTKAKPTEAA